jgi:hypothetical protein
MTMIQEPPEIDFSDDAPSPRSRRLRWAAAALVVVLAAGAGLGFVFSSHTSSPTQSGTTSATSPNALNNDPAPSLAGAYSDNPRTAFLALFAFHNWLYEHPSTSQVDRYTVLGSPAYRTELGNVQYLVAHHAHFPDDPRGYAGDVEFVKITQAPRPVVSAGEAVARDGHPAYGPTVVLVVLHELQALVYGPTGVGLQPGQQAGYEGDSYSLNQSSDGQWRIYSGVALHPPGGPQSLEAEQ